MFGWFLFAAAAAAATSLLLHLLTDPPPPQQLLLLLLLPLDLLSCELFFPVFVFLPTRIRSTTLRVYTHSWYVITGACLLETTD